MPRSRADENRKIRQDALREQLAEQCRLQHILETINKIEAAEDAQTLNKLKVANDQRIKLLGKYLPDLKATEITGGGENGEVVTKTVIEYVRSENTDA